MKHTWLLMLLCCFVLLSNSAEAQKKKKKGKKKENTEVAPADSATTIASPDGAPPLETVPVEPAEEKPSKKGKKDDDKKAKAEEKRLKKEEEKKRKEEEKANKQVRKDWDKKKDKMDGLEFKKVVEEREAGLEFAKTAQRQIDSLKAITEQQKTSNDELVQKRLSLEAEIEKLKTAPPPVPEPVAEETTSKKGKKGKKKAATSASTTAGAAPVRAVQNMPGVVFKVQIGYFKYKDLKKYFDNNPNFSGDIDEDGSKKYTIGYFTEYWEADNFKKYLREMGVKDAWVVSYKDGKRIPIKDVLEGTAAVQK